MQNTLYPEKIEAGCDEAGRGCLAGPVFAAAVILPKNFTHKYLTDSKKVSEKNRESLRIEIIEKALFWAVATVDNHEIDKINILNASILAMHKAVYQLKIKPEHLLIDGNRFKKYQDITHTCIIKGDAKFFPIAAASILAKTFRDDFMKKIGKEYPQYNWEQNKGYPTKFHRKKVEEIGLSPYHRVSFGPCQMQLKLKF